MNMDASTPTQTDVLIPVQPTLTEERVHTLYRGIPTSIAITAILDITLSLSNWNIIGHGALIVWNILMLCIAALRITSWYFWKGKLVEISNELWLSMFRAGALASGAVWGSSAYFIFSDASPSYQALLAFTLGGVASGSLTSLVIDRVSVLGFVILTVSPLTIRLFFGHGAIAIPMSIMTLMFIVFVITASSRARQQLENNFAQNARLIQWGNERIKQQLLSKIIKSAQSEFIANTDDNKIFNQLLVDVIAVTGSKFGFIGDILHDKEDNPYINVHAMTNIAWDTKSQKMFEGIQTQGMTFRNLDTLFGTVLTSQRSVISNAPTKDMRSGGTPAGHPPITAFMGIPIFSNGKMMAILCLANKDDGYQNQDIEFLKPITDLISQFIIAAHHQQQHRLDAEKIKRQSEHTQAILDEAFDAIITINKKGIITSFNHSAEIIFGYRADQIIGENISKLMPEPHRSHHDSYLHNHEVSGIKKMIGIGRQLTGVRRNGKEFPIELAISKIVDDNEPTYIGMVRDISERYYNEKLKHEFISTISHELRTPLTSISASLAIIDSGSLGKLPEKVSALIKIAKQNSARLQNLICEILDMDKLLSNQLEFNPRLCEAYNIVQNALAAQQYFAEKYNVKYRITYIDLAAKIYADEARTQQVLEHFLTNAAKFAHPYSDVDVAVTVNDDWVKFSVTDYGVGISEEFKPNVFKTFSQADGSSTRAKDGSGLGLAISKQLIDKMGGKIGFTSNIGQGSSFYFEFPLAQ